jgi:hypothetical protein
MEAIGIVALLTAVGAVFAFHGLRVLRRTRRFVAASASATGTVTDSVGRWNSDPGDDPGVSRLSHPVVMVRDGGREDGRVRVAGWEQPGAEGRPGGDGALRSPRPE